MAPTVVKTAATSASAQVVRILGIEADGKRLERSANHLVVTAGCTANTDGSESIWRLALALKFGITTKALGETFFPYLATVEGLKRAAQAFDKDVAKLSCCASRFHIR